MILFINTTEDTKENRLKFDALYNKYYKYVYKIAYNVIGDVEKMEDVVQDIFLIIWRTLDKLTNDKSEKAWISVITRNFAINTLKKKIITDKSTMDFDDNIMYDITPDLIESDLSDIIVSMETVELIYCTIKNMKKIYSDVLLLKYKFDCTPEMIADSLGLNIKTVYTRLERGNKILREKLYSNQGRWHNE